MRAGPRRVRIDLAYDGTEYCGWQLQPDRPTVQGVVEQALSRLHGGAIVRVRGASRTDAGVHARAQVADAVVTTALDDEALARALAGLLPHDVRPRNVRTVEPHFDAQRDAVAKTYHYRLDVSRHGNPFWARHALHHPYRLDESLLQDALAELPGHRDWSGFTGAACRVRSRWRHLSESRLLRRSEEEIHLVFTADGFLTHMVRNLVGTLLEVAGARRPPGCVRTILESGDRRLAGPTAPAHGLCLERVVYDPS